MTTYTLYLTGGHKIEVNHEAAPLQLEGIIKRLRTENKWLEISTPEGTIYTDAHSIVGFRPHQEGAVPFGEEG